MDKLLSRLENIEVDNILKTAREFKEDTCEEKINLSIGVCCNDDGELHIFDSVLNADKLVIENYKEKPYLLGNGTDDFSTLTQNLIFGNNSKYMEDKKICTIQCIGGTGAIFVLLEFLKMLNVETLYVTNPPYINHVNMIESRGFNLKYINFFDYNLIDINYDLFLNDLRNIPNGSSLILQISCYNPCSVNIEEKYFDEIIEIVLHKKHVIIFDIAYQGFGHINLEEDVLLIRKFEEKNISFSVCQSFSKNMSLYGERAGALHIVCKNQEEKKIVFNNLCFIVRKFYSSPVIHTNRILCQLLNNQNLKLNWIKELSQLSQRITNNRILFFNKLETHQKKYSLNYDWNVYKKQRGLFSFVPLLAKISEHLKTHHIYIINNGRINVSGITKNNVDYIADKICLSLSQM